MSLYSLSTPVFIRTLDALSKVLDKAEAHTTAKKIDPAALLTARLFPDMFPLTRQVQLACDFAAKAAARLTGADVPTFKDTETSFAELKQRIATATGYIKDFKAEQFNGAETRNIELSVGGNAMKFSGEQFLANYVLPNFYFHATTAYNILRHNGVEIGKRDFLGVA